MTETQVDNLQKIITFTTAQGKHRPDKINVSVTIFIIHEPRKFVINPAKNAELNTKIQVDLPEGLVGFWLESFARHLA